jgi:hypothetical protein
MEIKRLILLLLTISVYPGFVGIFTPKVYGTITGSQPPANGDWVIDQNTVATNENITITDGGIVWEGNDNWLNLTNCIITFANMTSEDQVGLAEYSGKLYCVNCQFKSANSYHYRFRIMYHSYAYLINTKLDYASQLNDYANNSYLLYADGVTVQNPLTYAVSIAGSGNIIKNSVFVGSSSYTVIFDMGSNNYYYNVTASNGSYGYTDALTSTGTILDYVTIHDVTGYCIDSGGTGQFFNHLTLYNAQYGICVGNFNVTIMNSVAHDVSVDGFNTVNLGEEYPGSAKFENIIAYNCGYDGFGTGNVYWPILIDSATFYNSYAGIGLWENNSNVKIMNVSCYGCQKGLMFSKGANPIGYVHNITIQNCNFHGNSYDGWADHMNLGDTALLNCYFGQMHIASTCSGSVTAKWNTTRWDGYTMLTMSKTSNNDVGITSWSFDGEKLAYTVNATSGATSITSVYCGTNNQPSKVFGATTCSYELSTKIMTITKLHASPADIEIVWYPPFIGGSGAYSQALI